MKEWKYRPPPYIGLIGKMAELDDLKLKMSK